MQTTGSDCYGLHSSLVLASVVSATAYSTGCTGRTYCGSVPAQFLHSSCSVHAQSLRRASQILAGIRWLPRTASCQGSGDMMPTASTGRSFTETTGNMAFQCGGGYPVWNILTKRNGILSAGRHSNTCGTRWHQVDASLLRRTQSRTQ